MLTGEPRSATVTAAEDTVVLVLPRAALAPLLEERPELAEGLSEAVVERRRRSDAVVEEHLQSASFRTPAAEARSVLDRIRRLFGL
jgi:CRP-like cAMP-binding protein